MIRGVKVLLPLSSKSSLLTIIFFNKLKKKNEGNWSATVEACVMLLCLNLGYTLASFKDDGKTPQENVFNMLTRGCISSALQSFKNLDEILSNPAKFFYLRYFITFDTSWLLVESNKVEVCSYKASVWIYWCFVAHSYLVSFAEFIKKAILVVCYYLQVWFFSPISSLIGKLICLFWFFPSFLFLFE